MASHELLPEPKLDAPGRGRIYDNIVETIANTPLVRIRHAPSKPRLGPRRRRGDEQHDCEHQAADYASHECFSITATSETAARSA